jgi:sorbitol-specific phosphotransferase system component IIA
VPDNVKSTISFRGSNLWILACAIVIASIGLNVNSTAVTSLSHVNFSFDGTYYAGFGLGVSFGF